MKLRRNKCTKDELRRQLHPTRPPRLEGRVKEANMQPARKLKRAAPKVRRSQPAHAVNPFHYVPNDEIV